MRSHEEFVDNSAVNEQMTNQEMQDALFYFKNHAYVMMVHYEPATAKIRFQEDFFFEESRKNKYGFAVINLYLREGLRTLIMGIKSKCDKFFEYNVERNEVYQIFQIDQTHADFAHSIYQSNHIILAGGTDHAVYGKNIAFLFSAQVDQIT